MEVVRNFNNELSSLYEIKPPVSKAKMTQITKSAIKGLKYYKHIVQSVEKFIQKCRPEYKVPGLYVIDSIVRQSRHQFGADKDVFAPRFAKNIVMTFQNLFKCGDDDRSKIVRVLNLWQKNAVFPSEVVQPLLDMGNPNTNNELSQASAGDGISHNNKSKSSELSAWKNWPQMSTRNLEKFTKANLASESMHQSSQGGLSNKNDADPSSEENTVKFNKKLLDFDYGDEDEEEETPTRNEEDHLENAPNPLALSMAQNLLTNPELLRQLQQMQHTIQQNEVLQSELQQQQHVTGEADHGRFSPKPPREPVPQSTKLVDFDYEDEEEEMPARNEDHLESAPNPLALSMAQNLLSNPELLRQLQQMQQTIQQNEALHSELHHGEPDRGRFSPKPPREPVSLPQSTQSISSIPYPEPLAPLPPNMMPPYPFDQSISNIPAPQPRMDGRPNEWMMEPVDMGYPPPQQPPLSSMHDSDIIRASQVDEDHRVLYSMPGEPPLPALPPQDLDERSLMLPMGEEQQHVRKNRSRSRSDSRSRRSGRHRSRSRSPRRRRSRSRSRSRSRRKRSRSREREKERQREREREREKEHVRKKKGIPPIKKNFMTVCSTTLWLGHVPKTMSGAEISSLLGEYGNVLSIDMIPPRGCAYVAMDRRQDAFRALQKLKDSKMKGSSIKVAWAPGKGMKGKEYKEYWETEAGVSYIPFEKLPNDRDSLDMLEEGGFIDEESMPAHLREMRLREKDKLDDMDISTAENNTVVRHGPKDIPMSSASIATSSMLPPSSMGMPVMMPQMMQPPQYGMPMPGMMSNQPPMVVPLPVGVPPPNPMMMVQPPSQGVLVGTPLPVGTVPQMPHLSMQHPSIPTPSSMLNNMSSTPSKTDASSDSQTSVNMVLSGDATPTEEDGTSISSPGVTNQSQTSSSVVSSAAVTAAHMGAPYGTGHMAHHGMVRPMLPVLPPVSSAGTPIPFPPPQVGFGFPPPPMRPGVPNQNMPGVIPMPNSPFPWLQKAASNPAFGAFGDSDMRYSVHGNNVTATTTVRQPTPTLSQSSGIESSILSTVGQQQVVSQATNSIQVKDVASSEKDNDEMRSERDASSGFKDKNGNHHMDVFGRLNDTSNDMRRSNKDESRDQVVGGMFGDAEKVPRFSGPPDFQQMAGAGIRMPWMHGPPGPRFPHAFNPNVPPFPPRGGVPRPMHQPMDMDFFRHQVPRMHMPGSIPPPQQQQQQQSQPQQRWKNDGYSQQRNQDRYSNRRDYRDNRMDDDDQGRGHRSRDDWGHRRDRWEDSKGRRSNDREDSSRRDRDRDRDRDRGTRSDDRTNYDNRNEEKKDSSDSAREDKPVAPKPKQKSDNFPNLADDLLRLQRYGKGRVSIADVNMKAPKSKKDGVDKDKLVKSDSVKEEASNKDEADSKENLSKTLPTVEPGNAACDKHNNEDKIEDSESMDISSADKDFPENHQAVQNIGNTSSDPPSVKVIDVKVNINEDNRRSRERGDRKRSRWGRTLSQEREFQQQIETEKKSSNSDGAITDMQPEVDLPPGNDIIPDIAAASVSGEEFPKASDDSVLVDCDITQEEPVQCPDIPVDAVPGDDGTAQDSTTESTNVEETSPMS